MSKTKLRPYADLKAKVREYEDSEGKKKGVYVKVGTLFASPHLSHLFISIEAVPVGDWDGAVSVFKRENTDQAETPNDKEPTGYEKAKAQRAKLEITTDEPINLDDISF